MPIKGNNTIKYNSGEKSIKTSTSQNNPNKSSSTKINTRHQVIQYLLIVHLMNQKIKLVIIEKMIV